MGPTHCGVVSRQNITSVSCIGRTSPGSPRASCRRRPPHGAGAGRGDGAGDGAGHNRQAGGRVGMFAHEEAYLSRLAARYREDRRAIRFIRAMPLAFVGPTPRRVLRIRVATTFFPPRSGFPHVLVEFVGFKDRLWQNVGGQGSVQIVLHRMAQRVHLLARHVQLPRKPCRRFPFSDTPQHLLFCRASPVLDGSLLGLECSIFENVVPVCDLRHNPVKIKWDRQKQGCVHSGTFDTPKRVWVRA